MKKIIILSLSTLFFTLFSCSPVSYIIIGQTKPPISPHQVKLYADYPEKFEKIALIEASSEFSLEDPSINITWQSKTNKIMERLKIKAAVLGANGIVIENTENHIKQNFNVHKDDEENLKISSNTSHYKIAKGTAIYVLY